MVILSSCCGCVGLKKGGVIIAWLQMMISILCCPYNALLLNEILSDGSIFRVVLPIFSYFLLYGIYKNDPGCMIPSLIMLLTTSVLFIIFPIVTLIFYFADIMEYISEMVDEKTFDGITILSFAMAINYVCAALILYLWFVLFSLYKSMRECNNKNAAASSRRARSITSNA
ncbi:uncharacterized protein LOC129578828 [Sitodiplosis mosellana]|uniref:uncharacterized protein LOC129578828 n=1 Tax=Sitodiplosis mosellana TaxID=263140 RepID=UPI0024441DC3|nr:uncharacterized protein LOC129578828 [Sitodiplosis mosellana]XP_055323981.1 uncharacterized protein LOC129578828 [Sitodiplosis mosellana]